MGRTFALPETLCASPTARPALCRTPSFNTWKEINTRLTSLVDDDEDLYRRIVEDR